MKEKFNIVLQKDEEIKWCNKVNIFGSMLKGLGPTIVIGGILSFFFTIFIEGMFFEDKIDKFPYFPPVLYVLMVVVVLYLIYSFLDAKNTFFAITNKRIIKRSGAFNNKFIHYTLKNVGTVRVNGSIVDSKNSATLWITIKDFHTDNNGNQVANMLYVPSLYNAYEAYNVLNELVEGNNESLRVKIEN